MMDAMHSGPGGWWMGGGMWFFSILFWIVIIAGVVFIVKWLMGRDKETSSFNEPPLEILKKRYAKGEIDQKTFEQMEKDIEEESA